MDCTEHLRFQIPMADGMIAAINEFRRQHGVGVVEHWDMQQAEFCKEHCIAMARCGELYHAESFYLRDWKEAVAMHSWMDQWSIVQDRLIFDVLGSSEPHRRILLESNCMAYAVWTGNWQVYLTIRAK